jgi:hypothetical protein
MKKDPRRGFQYVQLQTYPGAMLMRLTARGDGTGGKVHIQRLTTLITS